MHTTMLRVITGVLLGLAARAGAIASDRMPLDDGRTNGQVTSPAASGAVITIELHIEGAPPADSVLKAAIDEQHFCGELTRGWIHSVSHGPIIPGDEQYFAVPIYHVAFNQEAPHLQVGLNGKPGFSLTIDAYDRKRREYEGDGKGVEFSVAAGGKHYLGYGQDNPAFHYRVHVDTDAMGGQFTASHLVENRDRTVINVSGRWSCGR